MRLKKAIMSTMIAIVAIAPSLVYGQAYGTVATSMLNVREGAKTTAPIVQKLALGSSVEVVAEQDDWFKIALEDGKRAFVKAEYITVHRVVGKVAVSGTLNVRDYPSTTTGKVIGKLSGGTEVSVQYGTEDWYKISQDDFEGFVHKDYIESEFLEHLPSKAFSEVERVKVTEDETTTTSTTKATTTSSTTSSGVTIESNVTGEAIVSYAKQFLGNPYVYGGNSLTSGVDCSGFTVQIMKNFGINLSRSSSSQYSNNGYEVSRDSVQAGDLVFYGYGGSVSHVAIYIGNGKVIHANDESSGICISNAFSNTGKDVIGIKRVI